MAPDRRWDAGATRSSKASVARHEWTCVSLVCSVPIIFYTFLVSLSSFLALLAPICWVTTKSPDFGHVSPPLVARRNVHTCNASPSPKHPTDRALTGAG